MARFYKILMQSNYFKDKCRYLFNVPYFWPPSVSEDSVENYRRTLFKLFMSLQVSCHIEIHWVFKFLQMIQFFLFVLFPRYKHNDKLYLLHSLNFFSVLILLFLKVNAFQTVGCFQLPYLWLYTPGSALS